MTKLLIKNFMFSFEWDEDKNKFNQEKHNVSFSETQLAFYDEKEL